MTGLLLDRLILIYAVQILPVTAVLLPVGMPAGDNLPVLAIFLPVPALFLPVSELFLPAPALSLPIHAHLSSLNKDFLPAVDRLNRINLGLSFLSPDS